MKKANQSASPPGVAAATVKAGDDHSVGYRAHRHLRFGWWARLVWLSLGIGLEGFHGRKVGWHLDVPNEPQRLMWALGHAHGT